MLQEQHLFKTCFSFAIKLNYLFGAINKMSATRGHCDLQTEEKKEWCKAVSMDAKDCWEGENKRLWEGSEQPI